MSTQYLLNTIFETLADELRGNYSAQAHPNVDLLKANQKSFVSLTRPNEVDNESLDAFVKLISAINQASPLPETMKAVNAFAESVQQNLLS